jgi:hypothetical protein
MTKILIASGVFLMKNVKNVFLCAVTITMVTYNAEATVNNPNIFSIDQRGTIILSAKDNDSGNIFHDWACNCDNPYFAMVLKAEMELNPSEMIAMMQGHALSPKAFMMMSAMPHVVAHVENIVDENIGENLRTLLFSKYDGKTSIDIVDEKAKNGQAGCVLLQRFFKELQQKIEQRDYDAREKQSVANVEKYSS